MKREDKRQVVTGIRRFSEANKEEDMRERKEKNWRKPLSLLLQHHFTVAATPGNSRRNPIRRHQEHHPTTTHTDMLSDGTCVHWRFGTTLQSFSSVEGRMQQCAEIAEPVWKTLPEGGVKKRAQQS